MKGLDIASQLSRGERFNSDLYDSYPAFAGQTWSRGLPGNMVYPRSKWLDVAINDATLMDSDDSGDDVRHYCQEWSDHAFYVFQQTKFEERQPEVAADAVCTHGVLKPFVSAKGTLHFLHRNPGKCWIAIDWIGEVSRYHEEVEISYQALADEYGKEALSQEAQLYLTNGNNPFAMVKVVQCIWPNPDYEPSLVWPFAPDREKYLSCYYESATKHLLGEVEGTPWLPMIWRAAKLSDWWYGVSPAMWALSDARMNNQFSKTLIQTADLSARPPLLLPGAMKNTKIRNVPNGFSYYKEPLAMNRTQLYDQLNWPIGDAERSRLKDNIDNWFSVELFLMLTMMSRQTTGQPPTAYHIRTLQAEKMTFLGPQVGSYENDILVPSFEAVWEYETRYGTPPEPPQVLIDKMMERAEQGNELYQIESVPEFRGILAQAQKQAVEGERVDSALMRASAILEMFPEAKYVLKAYHLMRDAMQAAGLSQDLMRDEKEYAAIIEAIEKNRALQEQSEIGKNIAGAYQQMASGEAQLETVA